MLCGRVDWFIKKKRLDTCHVVIDGYGNPKSKISLWSVAFSLGTRPQRAWANLPVTLKSATELLLFNILKHNTSWVYLKAKNEEKLPNKIFFYWPGQKPFCPFWVPKLKLKKLIFPKFFLDDFFFEVKGRYCTYFQIFQKKIFNWKLCRALKFADFLELNL